MVFPTRWFSAAAASYKGSLTVYPAESWAPRVRAHEYTGWTKKNEATLHFAEYLENY